MQWNGIKINLDWDEFWKVNPLQNVVIDVENVDIMQSVKQTECATESQVS